MSRNVRKTARSNRTIPAGRFSVYMFILGPSAGSIYCGSIYAGSIYAGSIYCFQICADIIQHLAAEKSKGLLVLPAEIWAHRTHGDGESVPRAVSQRALCITDKIIISLISHVFRGRKVEMQVQWRY